MCVCALSRVPLSAAPWTVARQAPLSMEFSRQEHLVGYYFLLQGIFLIQGLNPCLLHLLEWWADSLSLCYLGRAHRGWRGRVGKIRAKNCFSKKVAPHKYQGRGAVRLGGSQLAAQLPPKVMGCTAHKNLKYEEDCTCLGAPSVWSPEKEEHQTRPLLLSPASLQREQQEMKAMGHVVPLAH